MAAVDPVTEASSLALPGLGRALVSAGKLGQKAAEEIFRKAQANRTSFIAELTGSGAVSAADLIGTGRAAEPSATVAARVARARAIQRERLERLGFAGASTNAQCPASLIEEIAQPDHGGLALLRDASERLGFSARAYHRLLKVARTLADLDGADTVGRIHLAEAISYRTGADRLAQAA